MKHKNPILNERAKTHGDYGVVASISQGIKRIIHQSPNWPKLRPSQRETLDMVSTKIARICAGDPNVKDHWEDLAGYPELVANERPSAIVNEIIRGDG